ncbi:hypothetical protein [Gracilibacillus timonensis]|uniref:hypothetical protein n=1 Tax=Gracilibacillus timonensis TaxID=1816696 RepID=UPI0008250FB5|nr:hypothetical protein [Gracilibacillus timonensis]
MFKKIYVVVLASFILLFSLIALILPINDKLFNLVIGTTAIFLLTGCILDQFQKNNKTNGYLFSALLILIFISYIFKELV